MEQSRKPLGLFLGWQLVPRNLIKKPGHWLPSLGCLSKPFQGKETDFTSARDKEFKLDLKVTDKNVEKMMGDAAIDEDLGIMVPGAASSSIVKEEVKEEVTKLKEMLADMKSAYLKMP